METPEDRPTEAETDKDVEPADEATHDPKTPASTPPTTDPLGSDESTLSDLLSPPSGKPASTDPLAPPGEPTPSEALPPAPGPLPTPSTEPAWNPLPPEQPVEPAAWMGSEPVATPPPINDPLYPDPQSSPSDGTIPPPPVSSWLGDSYEPLSSAYPTVDESAAQYRASYGQESVAATVADKIDESDDRRGPGRWQLAGVAIVAGLIGAGLALAGFLLLDGDDAAPPVANAEPVIIREQIRTEFIGGDEAAGSADAAAVARKVVPSIVHVQIGVGAGTGFAPNGSGSGVVLTADGYIATNNHVVEGSEDVQVIFADGRIYDAEVVGTDPTTDLAVVQIEAAGLIPVEIGSADDLGIGDVAIAAGNPLGLQGGPSVTVGVISAFNREVQTGAGAGDQLYGMLQTDAPITRGSSGGALVDGEGRLIGITTAVGVSDVGVEGIGFAIPVELVRRITDELIENGSVDHSFLGISGSTNFETQADGSTASNGITVQTFESGSAAEAAGLREGDVITEINGVAVSTIERLIVELREYPVGETIEVAVIRDSEAIIVAVDLGSRPASIDES